MKNVLLVDTNFSSFPIYIKLKEKGYNVYVVGNNDKDYLASSYFNHIKADYTDLKSLKNVIGEYGIDYVVPGCNDQSYLACASLNDIIIKNIDTIEKSKKLFNKYEFRSFCIENKLSSPKPYKIENINDFNSESVVVKPVDSYSGKGITIIKKTDDKKLKQAIGKAERFSKSGKYIIEEYIEGGLYSHSAFLENGKITTDFVVAEFSSVNPLVVDTSFVDVSFSEIVLDGLRKSVEKIAEKLSLCDGLIHTQFIMKGECFWLIEITRRCPGDLYSLLIEEATGFDYSYQYVAGFLGLEAPEKNSGINPKNIIRHTISQSSFGIFTSVNIYEGRKIVKYIQLSNCGQLISPSPEGRIAIAFIETENENELNEVCQIFLQRSFYDVEMLETSC